MLPILKWFPNFDLCSRQVRNRLFWFGLWLVFIIALSLRVYIFVEHLYPSYIHDGYQHVRRILYTQKSWSDPPATLGFEGPQQPLYYWIAALVIDPTLNTHDLDKQGNLAGLGLCISAGSMCILFLSLRYLATWLMRYIILIYFSLTPSLVLGSNCIGNDVLSTFFGVLFFYYCLKVNRSPRKPAPFWLAFMALILGVFSKLGNISLFSVVPYLLYRRSINDQSIYPTFRRCLIMVLISAIWLLHTLIHAWVPTIHQFLFVYTGVHWVDQEIHNIYGDYFVSFRLSDILDACQATTEPSTSGRVRFSFFSFQYANMFLGEYHYDNDFLRHYSMWVLLSGLFIPIGLLFFLFKVLKNGLLSSSKTVLLLLMVAETSAAAFVVKEPVCCSADFRYLFYLVPWIGYAVSRGLSSFPREWSMKIISTCLIGTYTVSCLGLLFQRLVLHP